MPVHKILVVPMRDGVRDTDNPAEYRFYRNGGYPEFEQPYDIAAVLTPTFHPLFKRHGWSIGANPVDPKAPTGYYNDKALADGYLPRELQHRMFVEKKEPGDRDRWGTLQDFADLLADLIKPVSFDY